MGNLNHMITSYSLVGRESCWNITICGETCIFSLSHAMYRSITLKILDHLSIVKFKFSILCMLSDRILCLLSKEIVVIKTPVYHHQVAFKLKANGIFSVFCDFVHMFYYIRTFDTLARICFNGRKHVFTELDC